jgi:hypothetical protein
MKFTLIATLLISAVSATEFVLFDEINYTGNAHFEPQ